MPRPHPHPSYSRFRQAVFGLLALVALAGAVLMGAGPASAAAAVDCSPHCNTPRPTPLPPLPPSGPVTLPPVDPDIHPYVGPVPAQDNAVDTAWARRYAVQLMYENPACNDLITGKFTQKAVSILRTISIFDATAPTQPAVGEGGGLLPWRDGGRSPQSRRDAPRGMLSAFGSGPSMPNRTLAPPFQ
ncbi:hypothetical protein [Parafrankia sp. BMG5.11]|uniref:hypothetical protein n=1 Tax=Parafrankia sp. BMG5.11 TaxID=222540 RepID=UPI001038CB8F|nr:hypothetical protein [Parafrankia sp. BMG5.11]TCJ34941.1 hypothetical protein E0504_30825 [Parafrankia sp. BMG5.11]